MASQAPQAQVSVNAANPANAPVGGGGAGAGAPQDQAPPPVLVWSLRCRNWHLFAGVLCCFVVIVTALGLGLGLGLRDKH
jgi:hypothetical protein